MSTRQVFVLSSFQVTECISCRCWARPYFQSLAGRKLYLLDLPDSIIIAWILWLLHLLFQSNFESPINHSLKLIWLQKLHSWSAIRVWKQKHLASQSPWNHLSSLVSFRSLPLPSIPALWCQPWGFCMANALKNTHKPNTHQISACALDSWTNYLTNDQNWWCNKRVWPCSVLKSVCNK